jgi:excisionase family DNA binding protein
MWARRLVGPSRDHVSTIEAAAYLGVTPQTVRNWVDRGWVKASRHHRLGRRQIPLAALDGVATSRAARRRIVKQRLNDQQIEDLVSGSADGRAQAPRRP